MGPPGTDERLRRFERDASYALLHAGEELRALHRTAPDLKLHELALDHFLPGSAADARARVLRALDEASVEALVAEGMEPGQGEAPVAAAAARGLSVGAVEDALLPRLEALVEAEPNPIRREYGVALLRQVAAARLYEVSQQLVPKGKPKA